MQPTLNMTKLIVVLAGTLLLLALLGIGSGFIAIVYPVTVLNEPLRHPISVVKVEDDHLYLANGQTVVVDAGDEYGLQNYVDQSDHDVDVETLASGSVEIYGRMTRFVCGTRRCVIELRLIAQPINSRYRQKIATGKVETAK